MANRRMLSMSVICSDQFLAMSAIAQTLYVQIVIRCDDDGFCNSVFSITRILGCSGETLTELLEKGFVLKISEDVYLVTDFRVQNQLRKNRYKPTKYMEFSKNVYIDNEDRYTLQQTNKTLFEEISSLILHNQKTGNGNTQKQNEYGCHVDGQIQNSQIQNSIVECNLKTASVQAVQNDVNSISNCDTENQEEGISLSYIKECLSKFEFLKELNEQNFIQLQNFANQKKCSRNKINEYIDWLITTKMQTAKKKLQYFVTIVGKDELYNEFCEMYKIQENKDSQRYCPMCSSLLDLSASECANCHTPMVIIYKGYNAVKEYWQSKNKIVLKPYN